MQTHIKPWSAEDWKHTHYTPFPMNAMQRIAFVCGRHTDVIAMTRMVCSEKLLNRAHTLGTTRAELVDCPDCKEWLEDKMGGEY